VRYASFAQELPMPRLFGEEVLVLSPPERLGVVEEPGVVLGVVDVVSAEVDCCAPPVTVLAWLAHVFASSCAKRRLAVIVAVTLADAGGSAKVLLAGGSQARRRGGGVSSRLCLGVEGQRHCTQHIVGEVAVGKALVGHIRQD